MGRYYLDRYPCGAVPTQALWPEDSAHVGAIGLVLSLGIGAIAVLQLW